MEAVLGRAQLPDREWARKNPEQARALRRAWEATHSNQRRAARNRWRQAHPEANRIHSANYTHRRRANGGNVRREAWEDLKALYYQRCAYCRKRRPLTQDHVVPISKGGWHVIENIVPACRSCNSAKRDRLLVSIRR